MARIDLGKFGTGALPETSVPRQRAGVSIGEGFRTFGQGIAQFSQDRAIIEQRRDDERKAKEFEANKLKAATAQKEMVVKSDDLKRQLMLDQADGKVSMKDMPRLYDEGTQRIQQEALSDFSDDDKARFAPSFETVRGNSVIKFHDDYVGLLDAQTDQEHDKFHVANRQVALTSPDRAIADSNAEFDAWGKQRADTLKPDDIAKAKRDEAGLLRSTNLHHGLNTTESVPQMERTFKALKDVSQFTELTTPQRESLIEFARSKIQQEKARIKADGAERSGMIDGNLKVIEAEATSGRLVPDGVLAQQWQYTQTAPDSRQRRETQTALELQPAIRTMMTNAAERTRIVNEANATYQGETDVAKRAAAFTRFEVLSRAAAQQDRQVKDDPFGAMEAYTGNKMPDLDIHGDLGAQLNERAPFASATQRQTGQNPGLLRPSESRIFANALSQMDERSQDAFFKSVNGQPDKDLVRQTWANMRSTEPAAAYAGLFSMQGAKDGNGRDVATFVLRGHRNIEDKRVVMPSKIGNDSFDEAFDKHAQTAFTGREDARAGALDSVRNYYAAIVGTSDPAEREDRDTGKLFDQAFTAVMGRSKPLHVINGDIFPPREMDDAMFTDAFKTRLTGALTAKGADTATIDAYLSRSKPVEFGAGRYGVIYGDTMKNDIVIDFNAP